MSKVINVATQCGFNHLGLFNTCFKRRFGISPGTVAHQVQPRSHSARRLAGARTLLSITSQRIVPLIGRFAGRPDFACAQARFRGQIRGRQAIVGQTTRATNPRTAAAADLSQGK